MKAVHQLHLLKPCGHPFHAAQAIKPAIASPARKMIESKTSAKFPYQLGIDALGTSEKQNIHIGSIPRFRYESSQ